jgi:hypothetical protein
MGIYHATFVNIDVNEDESKRRGNTYQTHSHFRDHGGMAAVTDRQLIEPDQDSHRYLPFPFVKLSKEMPESLRVIHRYTPRSVSSFPLSGSW